MRNARLAAAGLVSAAALVVGLVIHTVMHIRPTEQQIAANEQQAVASIVNSDLAPVAGLLGTPTDVVTEFATFLGEGGQTATTEGCQLFSGPAAAQFAAAHDAPDCAAAMLRLHDQITDVGSYVSGLVVPDTASVRSGTTAVVNGCALHWTGLLTTTQDPAPGPELGMFAMVQADGGDSWQITGYQPC